MAAEPTDTDNLIQASKPSTSAKALVHFEKKSIDQSGKAVEQHQGIGVSSVIQITLESLVTEEEEADTEPKTILTLLEKALAYREQNPEKWQRRQKEKERFVDFYGVTECDRFLDSYYQRVDEIKEERKKIEKARESEPPKLTVQLEFNLPRVTSSKKFHSGACETYASISANGVSVFDKEESIFDIFKSHKNEERGKEPELLISVSKARNLNNALSGDRPRLQECRVKCRLYPDCLSRGPKMKSSYVYCSTKGTTRWNHVIVLKGFSAKELQTKHVTLDVVGKNNDGKLVVGKAVLAGKMANLSESGSENTSVNLAITEWHQALEKPGSVVTIGLQLFRKEIPGSSGSLTGMLRQQGDSMRRSFKKKK